MSRMLANSSFVVLLAIAAIVAYLYIQRSLSYWERIGVKSVKPSFPFGNLGRSFNQELSLGLLAAEFYKNTSERFIGIYSFLRPTLIICDPELIRNICGRDFKHFYHRGFHFDEKNDPSTLNVAMTNGEKWKNLREILSPAFTSGKLKGMFDTIKGCGKSLQTYIDQFADTNEPVEVRDVFARFAMNIISAVAFGLDIDCIQNPHEEFRVRGMQIFATNWRNALRQLIRIGFPYLNKVLKVRFTDRGIGEFMTGIVKQNADYREKNKIVRKDFFQLLMDLYRSGSVQLDDEWKTTITKKSAKPLTLDEITAQAVIFFAASFESSSSAMSFCLYELAKNPEIQRKVHEEIDLVEDITYESIEKMKYLESCIDETLRKYPPLTIITRECTENYKISDTDIVIEKGTQILIPVYGLHHNEKYYPEPHKFDPNRFSAENLAGKTFAERPYMPFGSGQRLCMGMRLGKLEVKIGLVLMLQRYKFTLGAKYLEQELEFSARTLIPTPKYGIPLLVSKRTY